MNDVLLISFKFQIEQKKEAPKGYADTYGQAKPDKYKQEQYMMREEKK